MSGIPYLEALKQYQPLKTRPLDDAKIHALDLLKQYHPDHYKDSMVELQVGPNRGDPCHKQLADMLQANPYIDEADLAGATVIETDVLVVGGGGAGCVAALEASRNGARVLLATKLRMGDSNTVMAEGGIQASIKPGDSPQAHYDDIIKGGHYQSDKDLVAEMVMDGPDVVRWLIQQGMNFDVNEYGDLNLCKPGGASAERVMYFRDYTGLEMMRVLREAVHQSRTEIKEYMPAVELLASESGECAGAVLYSIKQRRYVMVKAQAVIVATGGIGRMHLNGFPTSNHFGATGDGLVIAYRLGAKLRDLDSFQYHPTCLAYPSHLAGSLITERVRSIGVYLLNAHGERFIDELKPRDFVSASILKECAEGRGVKVDENNQGVWLDTPGMELREPGILKNRFPKLINLAGRSKIDLTQTPMLVYPGLHYQNGGVKIDVNGKSAVERLYCVGEVSGGIHGKNRIMGNALLEIISFGRRAGIDAAKNIYGRGHKKTTIDHLRNIRRELSWANMDMEMNSPMLFPAYANFKLEQVG